jgi:hypothetical protein
MNRHIRDPGACPEPAEGYGGVRGAGAVPKARFQDMIPQYIEFFSCKYLNIVVF